MSRFLRPLSVLALSVLLVGTLFAGGALAAPSASKGAPAAKAFPYEVHRTVLENGLTVLLVPMPSEGLVSYWTVVRTGSRDEVEPGVTGFAHFFEHMMFRGTDKYPGPVYDGIVTSMGADANAYTTDDLTAYHMSVTRADLPKVVEIEADRFRNLKYSEPEFKTEAGAVYGEYRKSRTSPFEVLVEAVQDRAYDRHTYKHTTIGFEADIQAMPRQFEYSKGFFRRFYRPENCVLLVVGDFDRAALLAQVKQHYGGWAKGYAAPKIPVEPEQTAPRRVDLTFDGETLPILSIAWKAEAFRPKDPVYVAGLLLPDLLLGETSELHRKLVLDEQRLQALDGDFTPNRDAGLWWAWALVREKGDLKAVEGEILAAVDRLRKEGVDPAKLDAVRSRRRYGFLSGLDTPDAVASRLARTIALTGDVMAVDEMYATLAKVTPDDVKTAANRYLRAERSTTAVLLGKEDAAKPAEAGPAAILRPVAADPNVEMKVWVKVGSQDDPVGKEGLAALTAAMLSEGGTRKLAYDEILARMQPLAARLGASVDKEMTVFSGGAHRDVAGSFYPLFADALVDPGFRADDFERLRARMRDGIEKELRFSSDEELGKAALTARVYAGTRYAHLVEGTLAGLDAITLDDVKDFWKAHYTRSNVVPALGGAFEPTLAERLAADLARLPEGTPSVTPAPAPARPAGRNVFVVEKPGNATAISLGYPVSVSRGSREFYALWIANSWLGEHRNSASHLYQVIREERGINYGDYSYIEAYPQGGYRNMPPTGVGRRSQMFEVWLRPVPDEKAVFTLRAALREIDRLVKDGMSKEEFEARKVFLRKYSLQFAKTTEERLGYALDDRFYGIDGEGHLARFRKMMDEITLDEVNAALRKHLRTDDLVIAMVTAKGDAMKQALVSGSPSPIDYGGIPKPDAILAEDREIEVYPLRIDSSKVEIVPVTSMFAK